jgi:hypothetical protein
MTSRTQILDRQAGKTEIDARSGIRRGPGELAEIIGTSMANEFECRPQPNTVFNFPAPRPTPCDAAHRLILCWRDVDVLHPNGAPPR